jgi:hypothetical protein
VPVLLLLTVMQFWQLFLKLFSKDKLVRAIRGEDVLEGIAVGVSGYSFVLLLFGLEAFALPFGTKQGEIAFAVMNMRGLNITCIIAATLFGIGLPVILICGHSKLKLISFDTENKLNIACFASLLAVVVHLFVSGIWYMVENWSFVDSTLFFVAWEKDMLAYRVVRSWFSALTVLENVLSFGLVNAIRRWNSRPHFTDVSKMLPSWAVPIAMPFALLVEAVES